jgi:hypothetical protein
MASKITKIIIILAILSLTFITCNTINFGNRAEGQKDSLLFSISNMKLIKSIDNLDKDANKLLDKKFKTVLDKKIIAPSGNKNDYTSRAIYYWPKDNLQKSSEKNEAWEYKDGKINKESLTDTDHNNYYEMLNAVKKLSLSYYLFQKPEYAEKAVKLIKEWFIDEKTKMNPHFKHAQAIPGKNEGTPSGIIDSRGILWVVDAVDLVSESEHWNEELDSEFRSWTDQLFNWLLESDFGKRESATKNNHGTFYDLQIIKLATYLEEYNIAESFIDSVKIKRIARQIEPNGFQPEEMKRTKSQVYAVFNLSALLEVATIAKAYNEDLWEYETEDSGSIKDAVNYLLSISDFGKDSDTKNLIRILPKANELSNGEYIDELNKLKQKFDSFDLTELYFVN